MARTKRKFEGGFDAILAGFDQQPDEQAPGDQTPLQGAEDADAAKADAPENALRRLFKNISFPWPAKFSGFIATFGRRPHDAYDELAAETEPAPREDPPPGDAPQPPKTEPPKPKKTEDEAIAEELGLCPGLGTIDLKRIRRDFAKRNHPDRFEPARRRCAERRMSIANMLIDERMRQNRLPG